MVQKGQSGTRSMVGVSMPITGNPLRCYAAGCIVMKEVCVMPHAVVYCEARLDEPRDYSLSHTVRRYLR